MSAENYKVRWAGQHAVITTPAEIDMINASQVRQALLATASRHATVLIIDLSQTTFCDSSCVHAIVTAHQQATATRTQFRLIASEVSRVFKIVGLDQLIPIYPALQAVLAATPATLNWPG